MNFHLDLTFLPKVLTSTHFQNLYSTFAKIINDACSIGENVFHTADMDIKQQVRQV